MKNISYIYKGNGRDLKKIITVILKSGNANEIQRTNYCQRYSLNNNKIEKSESKILVIKTDDETKLNSFIIKNFPLMEIL